MVDTADAVGGIIPARAGFTPSVWDAFTSIQDHPRSRGVYREYDNNGGFFKGIIPARAGFTWPSAESSAPDRDHPRSRGVYGRSELGNRVGGGSSPLARGLQDLQWLERAHGGIIPARAGFTTRSASAEATASDHPRSRGVYGSAMRSYTLTQGSSPLARGLRIMIVSSTRTRRIIPARAGFTAARFPRRA